MTRAASFDAEYYRRFYGDPATRVSSAAAVRKLARFVSAYLTYLDVEVRTVLDLGCGLGHWKKPVLQAWPRASYLGVEYSSHLCGKHGWTQGSVVDFDPGRTFDLVICQGVMQYLDDRQAARAIDNLGRLCDGALYLEALTKQDWEQNCDRSVTDGAVHLRTGAWYRKRLSEHFREAGGGVFLARRGDTVTFELEAQP